MGLAHHAVEYLHRRCSGEGVASDLLSFDMLRVHGVWLVTQRVLCIRGSARSGGSYGRATRNETVGGQAGISGFALVSSPDPPIGRGGVSRALQNRIIMVRARVGSIRRISRAR